MKFFLCIVCILFFTFDVSIAQRPTCSVNGVAFECPSKYFKEIKVDSSEIKLFKYTDKDAALFFFMSAPSASFDLHALGKLILHTYPKGADQMIEWKSERNPLVMEMQTKYKYDLDVTLGLTETKLFEVKAFNFTVKGKKIVIGYVLDDSETPAVNRELFKAGEGTSDNAAGCNAVATALNSLTREFREKEQGCTLTAIQSEK
jgi:hypothetical protein